MAYCYTGKIRILPEKIVDLTKLAKFLGLDWIFQRCREHIISKYAMIFEHYLQLAFHLKLKFIFSEK